MHSNQRKSLYKIWLLYFFFGFSSVSFPLIVFVPTLIPFLDVLQVDAGIFQDPTIGEQKINFVATRLVFVKNTEVIL